jgi:methionine-rich copper-binding protein CopC
MNKPLKLLVALALAACAQFASAHAHLIDSTPANGEAVASPPSMRLKFSEALETNFSSVALVGPGGKDVAAGKVEAAAGDAGTVTVSLPTLTPGAYSANWSALAKDGHRTKGTIMFTVK